ncbi:uncharacterized protein LOC117168135 [Belonocnema kinseyi]|uniref:uncharacterized protein LOC117168135 n=1 Tax=Belonocnema kinseyi TaxID=2817044 RepID=UPI00143D5FCA|nr:uncharacterized protein LOC117168135 [Belonocnema kinseyi]
MDSGNVRKETIVKVRGWLRGIWEMRRRAGPVQQWVDSIPSPMATVSPSKIIESKDIDNNSTSPIPTLPNEESTLNEELKHPVMTASTPIAVPNSPIITMTGVSNSLPHHRLMRDPSLQSDSSQCSSVESLLELRKADPEAVLLSLGFGGCSNSPQENGPLSRIPKRFLQPSKLKGIAITDFVKQQQETNESLDTASLGYRGLTGSPYVAPSEIVQKIMERLRENESHELESYTGYNISFEQSPQEGRLSVLSPDNRQFLDQPRSKSPDMRNKRMIIGQKSFAFGCDGDLIEIDSSQKRDSNSTDIDSSTSSINEANLSPTDVMKVGPTYNDSKDSILINNQTINKRFRNLHTQLSIDDSVHSNQDCSSSVKPYHTGNVYSSSDSLKNQIIKEHKELIESMDRKSQWGGSLDHHNLPNLSRRSSEGFSETFQRPFASEGRRFSDSATQSDGSGETLIFSRRRSFRRQAKIRSEQFEAFEESFDSNDTAENDQSSEASRAEFLNGENHLLRTDNRPTPLQLVTNIRDRVCEKVSEMEETLNIELDEDRQSETDETSRTSAVGEVGEEEIEDNQCCSENRDLCCQSDKLGQICKHDENHTGCCYHDSSERCWRKMEKIIQKNKKLEKMVVKSKKGMAEIRDMLSSVLSVRMEPGF